MGCWTRSAKALLLGTSAIVLIKSAGISTAYAQDVVAVELDPVTVVATKTRERVSETLAPVSVVRSAPVRSAPAPADVPAAPTETQPQPQGPADQLRAAGPLAGASTLQQLMPSRASDVFFGMPGVTTQTRGDDPGTAVNIRGMQDFGRVAVLIDGARQNFQRTGHNADGVFYLEPEMLAGVDVVRGPVANIYGSGAIGGVVSFRTKDIEDVVKAGERWGVLSTGMVGSNIFRDMASMFAGARVHPNVDVFGGIVYRHNENYRDGDGKEWPNTGFDVASGVGKLTMRPALGHEVKLTGITYETNYATGQPNGPPNTLSIYDTKVQNQILTARYRYSRPDDKLFDFDGNVYSTSTLTEQVKTGGTNSAISGRLGSLRSFRIDTTGFDVNNTSRVDIPGLHNTVTYGADYFRDKVDVIDPTGTGDLFTPDGVRTVSGNFVQWRAQHSTWIETITALRYDNYKLEGGGFQTEGDRVSPKATVGVTPVRGFTVYGTYAEGYRAPAVTETLIFGLHPPAGPTQFGFIPNPQLHPEVGKNKELGVNLRYDDVLTKGDAFRGKVNYFRNDLTDFIELTVVGGGRAVSGGRPGRVLLQVHQPAERAHRRLRVRGHLRRRLLVLRPGRQSHPRAQSHHRRAAAQDHAGSARHHARRALARPQAHGRGALARGRRQEEGGHPGQPGALRQSRSAAERGLQHRQPLSRLSADRGHHGLARHRQPVQQAVCALSQHLCGRHHRQHAPAVPEPGHHREGRAEGASGRAGRTDESCAQPSKSNRQIRRKIDVHRHEPLPRAERIRARLRAGVAQPRHRSSTKVPGFVEFHLLKGPEHEDYTLYSSHTVWQSKATFEAWTKSEAFRAAHKDAGQNKPLYLDHPQFEGFEVRQTLRRGESAVA